MAKVDPRAPLPGKEVANIPHEKSAQDNYLDARGREMPSPLSIAPPIGYKKTPSLSEQIRQIVISEKLAQQVANQGYETFEEADDFDIPEDDIPASQFEMEEDFEGDRQTDQAAVEDWIKARAIEMGFQPPAPPHAPGQSAIAPGAGPLQPIGGAGEDLAIAPGEAPPSHGQAPAQPKNNGPLGFLRRG